MLPGVAEALTSALGLPVRLAEVSFPVDTGELALESDALTEASYRWLTAVGLALWGTDAYGNPSLMPAEAIAKRQQRKVTVAAAAAVVVIAAGLGAVSFGKVHSADNLNTQIRNSEDQASSLTQKISALGYVTEIPAQVEQRRTLATEALSGDIDWTGLLRRLAVAMPGNVTLQSISLTKTESTSYPSGPPAGSNVVGQITMGAQTTGGAAAVAKFIDRVSRVRGLQALWVSSTTSGTGLTTMLASAQVTTAAFSTRAATLPGGTK
jgi:Tfp pilus assembly protein PilN